MLANPTHTHSHRGNVTVSTAPPTHPGVVPHLVTLPLEAPLGQRAGEGTLGRRPEVVDGELLQSVDLPVVLSPFFQRCLSCGYDLLSSLWSLLRVHGLSMKGDSLEPLLAAAMMQQLKLRALQAVGWLIESWANKNMSTP